MDADKTYIAIDFGGGSGRVIAGSLTEAGEVEINEVHRFANGPVKGTDGLLHWDFDMLRREMLEGLKKAAALYDNIVSIGIDTWGVDFGLIDADGCLTEAPLCYRDESWLPQIDRLAQLVGAEELYNRTGLQPIGINSVYRLMWMAAEGADIKGKRLLFMPDLFNYVLTGVAVNEYTIASTSGLLDARTRQWDSELITRIGLPEGLFQRIVHPGESLGRILPEIAAATGLNPETEVIAVGSHDTASAVNAITTDEATAFLSSGTWSLLGVELPSPVTTPEAAASGYANEGGTEGILFLQNITGLWILQQLVEQWRAEEKPHDYPTLIALAEKAKTETVVDVDDPVFSRPGDMEKTLRDYCATHGLKAPEGQGETVRCVLLSLAARYARGLKEMERVIGRKISHLHIIGGGSRNLLLNALTAEATGRQVSAGPVEATAIGNILTQSNHFINS